MNDNSLPNSPIDPYEPPKPESQSTKGLGANFWIPIWLSLALTCGSLATFAISGMQTAFYPLALFGILGGLSTAMAIARAIIWQKRMPYLDNPLQGTTGFSVFLTSMLIGFVATTISLLCCSVICLPLGFAVGVGGGAGGATGILALSLICSCLGLFVGYLFVRWTVPKVLGNDGRTD